ncbi:MAG: peptide/nickel transport system substrate-binding protein, partial [Frankiaceae bacterium]|nr:peptide/nickel transport system substrate-binding protein [Frankiaceae bacterium]
MAGSALLLVSLLIAACGGSSPRPAPQPTRSPEPVFSQVGKPGGTLRVVGTVRAVPLDPALARDDAALLVNRLIYRQLYSYRPGDQDPSPDLATGPPRLSQDRLTASVSLGFARWNVSGGRGVTANDVLRSLKRLCSPGVLAPERSYLSEVVVGYADFCTRAGRARLGRGGQPDPATIDVPGLQAVGDGEVQIKLRRPAADLTRILALPALSPLPFEIEDGFDAPLQLVTDGPYRFVDPKEGESYRLSRNAAWDPGTDRIRGALVDRVAFRGGLTADDVQQRLATNDADLSWDTDAPPAIVDAPATPTGFGLLRLPARDHGVVAVGTRGPAARALAAPAARGAVVACLDRARLR